MILPSTTERVSKSTTQRMNQRIHEQMERRLSYFAEHPDEIDRRLNELKYEWDIERTLQAQASSLALAGVVLSTFVDRRFAVLPAAVTGFLLLHALQGWCPPVPLLRRLGIRTATEIAVERYSLKLMRGDFQERLPRDRDEKVRQVLYAVKR